MTSSAEVPATDWRMLDGKDLTIPAPVAKQIMLPYRLAVQCGMVGIPLISDARDFAGELPMPRAYQAHQRRRWWETWILLLTTTPPYEQPSPGDRGGFAPRAGRSIFRTHGAGERPALSLRVSSELACGLACRSEVREAKIRELQESINNGTYHATAEQIADKMLRNILRPDLT